MQPPRPEDFARHFPENGMKLLLQEPANVRDLLAVAGSKLLDTIDFGRLQPDPTTYVQRDFRHAESDIVLRGPLRGRGRGRRSVVIYILIEHQTEPDRLMPFRVLEYVVLIYRAQLRDWARGHDSFADFSFQPVLPVVLYTGPRAWPALGRMPDLLAGDEALRVLAPDLAPLFVSVRDTPAERLAAEGGAFGQVLRLVQRRQAHPGEFRVLLGEVVRALEGLPRQQRLRWLGLLSYVHALVYHERQLPERPGLQQLVEDSVQTDEHRKEVRVMGKTIADQLKEEGMKLGEQRALLRLLRGRFGELPQDVTAAVESCDSVERLQAWFDRAVKASSLEAVDIRPQA